MSVILYTGGGRPRQVPPGQVHPPTGTPPGRYTPLGRYTPWEVHPQAGTPPWAGTPPGKVSPGRYIPGQVIPPDRYSPGQVHPPGRYPPGQVHPPAMHAGIQSTSGRYASYSNAFLFIHTVGNDVGKLTPANTFVVVSIVQERIVYDN